ncbi:MAG: flavodoxin family protein [Candidatus Bipolaricaulota bacterium]|nr:MAG: flavodoxin family protein [Candidatus Bipolaricaulota bacterium]
MKIGIVVYSWSGNTLSVAEKLKERLAAGGHDVALEQVALAEERKQGAREFTISGAPDPSSWDAVVFGAAVEAFSLSPVLKEYLGGIAPLDGKKVACLVSQQFPYPWMGGNRAIRQMRKLCESKGGSVAETAVVNWAKSKREKTMAAAIERLSAAF